jgi:hypothetical protein
MNLVAPVIGVELVFPVLTQWLRRGNLLRTNRYSSSFTRLAPTSLDRGRKACRGRRTIIRGWIVRITRIGVESRQEPASIFGCVVVAQLRGNHGCVTRGIGNAVRGAGNVRANGRIDGTGSRTRILPE